MIHENTTQYYVLFDACSWAESSNSGKEITSSQWYSTTAAWKQIRATSEGLKKKKKLVQATIKAKGQIFMTLIDWVMIKH